MPMHFLWNRTCIATALDGVLQILISRKIGLLELNSLDSKKAACRHQPAPGTDDPACILICMVLALVQISKICIQRCGPYRMTIALSTARTRQRCQRQQVKAAPYTRHTEYMLARAYNWLRGMLPEMACRTRPASSAALSACSSHPGRSLEISASASSSSVIGAYSVKLEKFCN